MAKTIITASSTPKTSVTDGITLTSAVMMSRMPGSRASSRSGRSTRRMRSDLSCPKMGTYSASSPRIEIITMVKSRMFQPRFRYASSDAWKKP